MRAKLAVPVICGAIAFAGAGCAGSESPAAVERATSSAVPASGEEGSIRPTLTESRLQPPPLQNEYTTEGRPEVVFDPCTWISDQSAEKAGLDPASRRRGDDTVAEYTFLTCDFDSLHWDLQINSGNVTWEEDLQKNGAFGEPLTVNGREAMWVRDPHEVKRCSIHLRTKVGFVMFTTKRTFEGSEAGLQKCDGVLGVVEALEPEIGSEN
ncbi:DUF3558 domain-containing protein [Nocardia zapadnayensis]|nr:DUF3558 family protein [Nocardia zapadnayensis]MCX0271185.1 DUF3558 domain-containing protein [Nocardia zapadnayensis]